MCSSDSERPGQFTGVVGPGVRRPNWKIASRGGRQSGKRAAGSGQQEVHLGGWESEAEEPGGKMPDGARRVYQPLGALFFAFSFSLSRSACGRARRYPTSTSGPAQILPRLPGSMRAERQQGDLSIKMLHWKKVGEGSNFCVWRFCPPHRLRSL